MVRRFVNQQNSSLVEDVSTVGSESALPLRPGTSSSALSDLAANDSPPPSYSSVFSGPDDNAIDKSNDFRPGIELVNQDGSWGTKKRSLQPLPFRPPVEEGAPRWTAEEKLIIRSHSPNSTYPESGQPRTYVLSEEEAAWLLQRRQTGNDKVSRISMNTNPMPSNITSKGEGSSKGADEQANARMSPENESVDDRTTSPLSTVRTVGANDRKGQSIDEHYGAETGSRGRLQSVRKEVLPVGSVPKEVSDTWEIINRSGVGQLVLGELGKVYNYYGPINISGCKNVILEGEVHFHGPFNMDGCTTIDLSTFPGSSFETMPNLSAFAKVIYKRGTKPFSRGANIDGFAGTEPV